jgi:hypothetical protein
MPTRTAALTAAFIPHESPPLVKIPIFYFTQSQTNRESTSILHAPFLPSRRALTMSVICKFYLDSDTAQQTYWTFMLKSETTAADIVKLLSDKLQLNEKSLKLNTHVPKKGGSTIKVLQPSELLLNLKNEMAKQSDSARFTVTQEEYKDEQGILSRTVVLDEETLTPRGYGR